MSSERCSYPKMESADRLKMFEAEIALIADSDIRELVKQCLMKAPNYFFYMPASTSGRHHSAESNGKHGLVKHTKMLVAVAKELSRLEIFEKVNKDCAIAACILHDTCKCGNDDDAATYEFEHPLLAGAFVKAIAYEMNFDKKSELALIKSAIESHMGQWNYNHVSYNKKWLPKPRTQTDFFVHLCDYLASRKTILVQLNEE